MTQMSAYRVVHNRDMVAHLPPMIVYDYYHHVQEIWYQNDMAVGDPYFMCNPYDGEDSSCSDSLTFTTSIDDHKHYFGLEVSNYGSNGCSNDGSKAFKPAKTLSRPYRLQRMDKEKLAKKVLNVKKQSRLHKNKILH
uniref:Uncharacterized protein n=1 Tax=Panagrolaimus davidi TaxID=227884 RepID=A0A914Q1B0_9BILA